MNESIVDGTPGFVSDDYLNAISAETTVTATELCMVGLWERDDERSGYVINDPMVTDLVEFHEHLARDKAFCAATGGHDPDPETDGELCQKCHKPLMS